MRKLLLLAVMATSSMAIAGPVPSGCPTCIQNSAAPQNAQMNIGTATVRGELFVPGTATIGALSITSISGDGSGLTNLNASALGSGTVPSARVTGSYTGITGVGTLAAGTWQGTAVGTQYGGTGQNWSGVAAGALPVFTGTGALGTLATSQNGRVLSVSGGVPAWTTAASSATNIVGGAVGSVPYQSAANTTVMLAAGTNGYLLGMSGGAPAWVPAPSTPPGGSLHSVQTNDGSGGFAGDTGLTWDGSILTAIAASISGSNFDVGGETVVVRAGLLGVGINPLGIAGDSGMAAFFTPDTNGNGYSPGVLYSQNFVDDDTERYSCPLMAPGYHLADGPAGIICFDDSGSGAEILIGGAGFGWKAASVIDLATNTVVHGTLTADLISGPVAITGITLTSNNSFFGIGAGANRTSGAVNTLVGHNAGNLLTTENLDTFIGDNAGGASVGTANSVIIGASAGYYATGSDNVFIGEESVSLGAGGSSNVTLGRLAGRALTTGSSNVIIGRQTGYLTTTGDDNTMVGREAGTANVDGYDNTLLGRAAGNSNVSGHDNTAVGIQAWTGTGNYNTFIGNASGGSAGAGDYNSIFGSNAGQHNAASFNSIYGALAGQNNGTGTYLAFFGEYAGNGNTTGSQNTHFGGAAGQTYTVENNNTSMGYEAAYGATGSSNTIVGATAGYSAHGDGNVLIGFNAGASFTANNKLMIANNGSTNLISGDFSTGVVQVATMTVTGQANVGYEKITNACGAGVTTCTATCSSGKVATGCGPCGVAAVGGLSVMDAGSATSNSCTCNAFTTTTITAYAFCARVGN